LKTIPAASKGSFDFEFRGARFPIRGKNKDLMLVIDTLDESICQWAMAEDELPVVLRKNQFRWRKEAITYGGKSFINAARQNHVGVIANFEGPDRD